MGDDVGSSVGGDIGVSTEEVLDRRSGDDLERPGIDAVVWC